jgi:hypothetical protein
MTVAITFHTTSASEWTGIGVDLTAAQVDRNFYNIQVMLDDLDTSRPEPNNIASITTNGLSMTIVLDDATEIGPIPLPVLQFHWRGPFQGSMVYDPLDAFSVGTQGIYSVMVGHITALPFDETAVGSPLAATALVVGQQYKVTTAGTTDFTLVGSTSNVVGTIFRATAAGTGSGTASPLLYNKLIGQLVTDGQVIVDAGTSRTLSIIDAGNYIRFTSGAGVGVTIPPAADVTLAIGTTVAFEQVGAGLVTVAPGAGVVLNCAATHLPVTNGQFAVAQVKKVAADEWTIFGNLEAV